MQGAEVKITTVKETTPTWNGSKRCPRLTATSPLAMPLQGTSGSRGVGGSEHFESCRDLFFSFVVAAFAPLLLFQCTWSLSIQAQFHLFYSTLERRIPPFKRDVFALMSSGMDQSVSTS